MSWVKCKYCKSANGRPWYSWIVNEERIFIYECCMDCSEKQINKLLEERNAK